MMFAGREMPMHYFTGILAEGRQCRTAATLFDGLHLAQARLDGAAPRGLERLVLVDGVLYLLNDDDFGIVGERTKLAAIKGLPLSQ